MDAFPKHGTPKPVMGSGGFSNPHSFVARKTRTYALLEVSAATFADIQARLARAGVLSEYYREYERPLIILGGVGLASEEKK